MSNNEKVKRYSFVHACNIFVYLSLIRDVCGVEHFVACGLSAAYMYTLPFIGQRLRRYREGEAPAHVFHTRVARAREADDSLLTRGI